MKTISNKKAVKIENPTIVHIAQMHLLELAKDKANFLKENWISGGFEAEHGEISQAKVARLIGVSYQTINKHWNKLEAISKPLEEQLPVRKVSYSTDKIDAYKELISAYEEKKYLMAHLQKELDDLKESIEISYKELKLV